ncbi:MAG: proton-conducting transporter membrane subunit [Deltaproteobacteria bacterium]|nr:proton-conducting transporter membrane subunit [Deltaproteobacteria bacterium]
MSLHIFDDTMPIFLHPSTLFILLALLLPFLGKKAWRWLMFIPPFAAIVISFGIHDGGYWTLPYLSQDLVLGRVDRLSILFVNLFALQSLICVMFAFHRKDRGHHVASNLYMAGAFGCILAGDYWTFFIFWQLMTVSSAFLIWLNHTARSASAGFRYLLLLIFGSVLLLAGILLKDQSTSTFALVAIDPAHMNPCDWLILSGFCINAALFPLHAWLTDAYPEATLSGMVFLTSYTTHTAVYALARCFAGHEILVILGTVSALWGMAYALFQHTGPRILCYLIVSQIGIMVAGIGIGTHLCVNGAMAHAYAHTFYNGLLFMAMGALITASGGRTLFKLTGTGRRNPLITAGFLFGALSLSCMPLLSGFVSIPMIIHGAMAAGRGLVAFCLGLALLGIMVTAGLKIPMCLLKSTADQKEDPLGITPVPINMPIALGKACMVSLILGIFPHILYRHLPHPMDYAPYTLWNVAGFIILSGFAILIFLFLKRFIGMREWRCPDMDLVYRLAGDAVTHGVARPLAWLDDRWSEVYRKAGIRGLMGLARGMGWVDKNGIDTTVDGVAHDVRRLSRRVAKFQDTSLQDQLAWMILLALGIFAVFWFWV